MTPRIFGRMREAGASAAIGRYDEARLLYASDAFAGAAGEHPERRTVHIAVDLFLGAGLSGSRSPARNGPFAARQRATAGLRAHRHPRRTTRGRAALLHALWAPLPASRCAG